MKNGIYDACLVVRGLPKGQPRGRAVLNPRTGKARVYDPGTANGWKNTICRAIDKARDDKILPIAPLPGPIYIRARFQFPRPARLGTRTFLRQYGGTPIALQSKPDIDNLLKAAMDALTDMRVWVDDAQVYSVHAEKWYAAIGEEPGMCLGIFWGYDC